MHFTEGLAPISTSETATKNWRHHAVTVLLAYLEVQYKVLMFLLLFVVGCLCLALQPSRLLGSEKCSEK